MDIEVLRVRMTEEELTSLTGENVPPDTGVKGLRITLTMEGIQVNGQYTGMLLPISFETLWEPLIIEEQLQARLARITVAGFPATKLRGVLLRVLADNIGGQPGVHFEGEVIRLDLAVLLAAHKIPVRVKPTAVRCAPGFLVLEAGV
jgi:hypothetical protein